MLNILWLGLFVASALSAVIRCVFLGDDHVFAAMVQSLFEMAKLSVETTLTLLGTLTLWLGFMRIAEKAGLIERLACVLGPLFEKLMPDIPRGHPAIGFITMNFAANGLGLDNAATPIGLKAMRALQAVNPTPDALSRAQLLFLVMNTSSLTLLPVSIFMYRAQMGAPDPTMVFLPILIATSIASLCAFLLVAIRQRLDIWNRVVLAYALPLILFLAGAVSCAGFLSSSALSHLSSLFGNVALFSSIMAFLLIGAWKKIPVYDCFIEGAQDGFNLAKDLLPYLVAMLCAVGVMRASGAMEFLLFCISSVVHQFGLDDRFIEGLLCGIIKPFSGSGARALMLETMKSSGVDSFGSLVSTVIQGSTETTFYVLSVYCGAIGMKRTGYSVLYCLFGDLVGILCAICVCYVFFG